MTGTLILATHGIWGGPGSAADHARAISARGGWAEVRVGCLKAEPTLASAFQGVQGPVTVVPLLMAEGYIHAAIRRRVAAIAPDHGWRMTAPVGTNAGLPALILARANAVRQERGWEAGDTGLLLIGHGTPRHVASAAHARAMALSLAGTGYRAVASALLEEPPLPGRTAATLPGRQLIVVGLFLDNGPHGDADVRAALAPVGKPVAYAGAVGADPSLATLILRQAMLA